MDKKKLFFSFLFGACALMLIFLVVKGEMIDKRLEQISRPSRLFNLGYIASSMPMRPDWEVRLSPDHDRFFYVASQDAFRWLAKGANCYTFASTNGKFVVKFVNLGAMKPQQPHGFFNKLFSNNMKQSKKLGRFEDLFMSARICFDELSEETGVIYAHLNRTRAKIHGLKLIDSYGQSQRACGDDTCFIVQKKAKPLIPMLTALMDNGEIETAKVRIDQMFDLLISLARKGFVDGDDGLIMNNNIGFTESRAIYIDTWHFFRAKNLDVLERLRYEIKLRLVPLERWLKVNYPQLSEYYSQKSKDVIAELVAEKKGMPSAQSGTTAS